MDALKCPIVRPDALLHRLSRVMSCLLLHRQASNAQPSPEIADSFVHSFYSHLLPAYGTQDSAPSEFTGGLSPGHRRLVDEVISSLPGRDVTPKEIADRCGLSVGHFRRVFRESFGRPFHQHVIKLRLEHSRELLALTNLPLGAIARRVGYADQSTFTESFARATGTSPGRFRRQSATTRETHLTPRSQAFDA